MINTNLVILRTTGFSVRLESLTFIINSGDREPAAFQIKVGFTYPRPKWASISCNVQNLVTPFHFAHR